MSLIFQNIFAAFFLSFFVVALFGKRFIALMHKWQKGGQPIREYAIASHVIDKAGTPTMGGLGIIGVAILINTIIGDPSNFYVLVSYCVLIVYGLIGFLDDYLKVKKRNSDAGLTAKSRFLLQMLFGCLVTYVLSMMEDQAHKFYLFIPFFGQLSINISWLYIFLGSFIITGCANSVNLTDGLDGLVTIPVVLSLAMLGAYLYVDNKDILIAASEFLPKINNALGDVFDANKLPVLILIASLIGSCVGFLWYNAKPAQIFMGDVGALPLGAMIGILGIIARQELLLVILGLLFVIETLSVVIQVGYYKRTKKRVFLMAPIHHHFEKKGWPETKIVTRFWIVSLLTFALSWYNLVLYVSSK